MTGTFISVFTFLYLNTDFLIKFFPYFSFYYSASEILGFYFAISEQIVSECNEYFSIYVILSWIYVNLRKYESNYVNFRKML